jgi:hypothetical protein
VRAGWAVVSLIALLPLRVIERLMLNMTVSAIIKVNIGVGLDAVWKEYDIKLYYMSKNMLLEMFLCGILSSDMVRTMPLYDVIGAYRRDVGRGRG